MLQTFIVDMRPVAPFCIAWAESISTKPDAWLDIMEIVLHQDPYGLHTAHDTAKWDWSDRHACQDPHLVTLAFDSIASIAVEYIAGKVEGPDIDCETQWLRADWIKPGLLRLDLT